MMETVAGGRGSVQATEIKQQLQEQSSPRSTAAAAPALTLGTKGPPSTHPQNNSSKAATPFDQATLDKITSTKSPVKISSNQTSQARLFDSSNNTSNNIRDKSPFPSANNLTANQGGSNGQASRPSPGVPQRHPNSASESNTQVEDYETTQLPVGTTTAQATYQQPRMTINLKECRYNLFWKLALEEFNWRCIMSGDHIVTPANHREYQSIQKQIKKLQQEFQQKFQTPIGSTQQIQPQQQSQIQQQKSCNNAEIDAIIEERDNADNDSQTRQEPEEKIEEEEASQKENQEEKPTEQRQKQASKPVEVSSSKRTQLPQVDRAHQFNRSTTKNDHTKSPTADRRVQRFQNSHSNLSRLQSSISGYNQTGTGKDGNLPAIMPAPQFTLQDEQLMQKLQQFTPSNPKDLNWDICWQDHGITPDFLTQLQPYQRVNHFLGMYNIARKNTLSIHLKRFLNAFPDQYGFFPQTWLYPQDLHEISEYNAKKLAKRKAKLASGEITEQEAEKMPPVLFIAKPEAGSQGRGIFISNNFEQMKSKIDASTLKHKQQYEEFLKQEEQNDTAQVYSHQNTSASTGVNSVLNDLTQGQEKEKQQNFDKSQSSYVIQKYLNYPALWRGHKYDFRIYVLVTSVIDPMTIYLYKDGLVRLASEKYDASKNFNDPYTHLTNYSLNKKNSSYDNDNHKLSLNNCLKGIMTQPPIKKGKPGATRSATEIWDEIEGIIVKTIITVQPQLQHIYRSCQTKEPDCCFELLGFDIMLDQKLKPWMLEVNHTPSFGSDTSVDEAVKKGLIKNTLEIIQMSVEHRKRVAWDLKQEMKQQIKENIYKRPSAIEHCQRVRFDPDQVEQRLGTENKYKLIYPKEAPGPDPDLYNKFQKKANDIWRSATGTNQSTNHRREKDKEEKPKKPKKKKKKALPKDSIDPITAKQVEELAEDDSKLPSKEKGGIFTSNNLPSAKKRFSVVVNSAHRRAEAGSPDNEGDGSRNFHKAWNRKSGGSDEFQANQALLDIAEKNDHDETIQYNFLEKKEQSQYKSMQKTLKSDKDIDGNSLPSPSDLMGNNFNAKNRSQQKPQRHLSALHTSANHHLQYPGSQYPSDHTPACMSKGGACHLRTGMDYAHVDNSLREKRHISNTIQDQGISVKVHLPGNQISHNLQLKMVPPCMQDLYKNSGQPSPMINQISHAKGTTAHHLNGYNQTQTSGFYSGTTNRGGLLDPSAPGNASKMLQQSVINNQSFKSQQPTQSSKAKQVHLPNRKIKEQQSYSLQMMHQDPVLAQTQQHSQIQLPFPIQTYTKQQLEKMGIPPSTFHNLPLMTQSEIQQHLKQQLREELSKRNGIVNGGKTAQNQQQKTNLVGASQSAISQQQTQSSYEQAHSGQQQKIGSSFFQYPTSGNHLDLKQHIVSQISQQQAAATANGQPGAGQGGGKLYAITRKQKEQLEFLIAQGQLPMEAMRDEKTIAELFNTLTDETGSMRLRYKEYCRQLIDKNAEPRGQQPQMQQQQHTMNVISHQPIQHMHQQQTATKAIIGSSYYPTISHLNQAQQNQQAQNGATHNAMAFQGATEGQFSKEAKNSGLDSQIQYVLNNGQQQQQQKQQIRASGQNHIPMSKEAQLAEKQSVFSSYMQSKANKPTGPYSQHPDSNIAIQTGPAPTIQSSLHNHKSSYGYNQYQQRQPQNGQHLPASQMSVAQIQVANNQSVNSWFISRLKSILQGSGSTSSQNPQVVGPQQILTGKRYEALSQQNQKEMATAQGGQHSQQPQFMRDQKQWQQMDPQHSQILMQALHSQPKAGTSGQQSQAMAASQKQQQIMQSNGGLGLMSSNELAHLGKRQKSREADSSGRIKQIQGSNIHFNKPAMKDMNLKASSVEDAPYSLNSKNVITMPDVVSKVTQNSMSFTAEQKPRKQSTQSYPLAKSIGSATTTVPAINSGAPNSLIRNSREGQISSAKAVTTIEGQQYSDLGSSYKSGIVSGQDQSVLQYKANSQLGKITTQQPMLQQGTIPGANSVIGNEKATWIVQDPSKRVNTYIRNRELSNFLRRTDDQPNSHVIDPLNPNSSKSTNHQDVQSKEYATGGFGSSGKDQPASDVNGDCRKTRNLLTSSDQQNQRANKQESSKLQSERDFQRKMTVNAINNRGAQNVTMNSSNMPGNSYQNIVINSAQAGSNKQNTQFSHSDGMNSSKNEQLQQQQRLHSNSVEQTARQQAASNSVRLARKQSSANPNNKNSIEQTNPQNRAVGQAMATAEASSYHQENPSAVNHSGISQFIKHGGQAQIAANINHQQMMRQGVHMAHQKPGQGVDPPAQAHVVQLVPQALGQPHRGSEMQKRTQAITTTSSVAASGSMLHQTTGIQKQHSYPPGGAIGAISTTSAASAHHLQQQLNKAQTLSQNTSTNVSQLATRQVGGPRNHNNLNINANQVQNQALLIPDGTIPTQATGNTLQAGHSGKYLGLGNKSGLGGTHRHSLEKLKEYESRLLLSSTAGNTNSNAALMHQNSGTQQEPPLKSGRNTDQNNQQQFHVRTNSNDHRA